MKTKELSVVIVNLNGWKYLEPLLKSIQSSTTKSLEIVMVDNGSISDGKKIKSYCLKNKNCRLVNLHKNVGPAMARNIGAKNSTGKFLSFLDNDTLVDKNWAKTALSYFKKNKKVGVIQCKLLLENDHTKIDYVGEYLGSNGFLVQECPAGTKDIGQFQKTKKILAAKSAGMFIRRSVFEQIGGFDDDYFIYVEETDLGWRSWLAGWQAHYLPTSIVYHHFGTSSVILGLDKASTLAKFHGPKNYISTLVKNLSTPNLFRILPVHIFLWLSLAVYRLLMFNATDFFNILSGIIWPLQNIKSLLIKRSKVQSIRVTNDLYVFNHLVVRRSLWYFIKKATVKTTVGNAKSY